MLCAPLKDQLIAKRGRRAFRVGADDRPRIRVVLYSFPFAAANLCSLLKRLPSLGRTSQCPDMEIETDLMRGVRRTYDPRWANATRYGRCSTTGAIAS